VFETAFACGPIWLRRRSATLVSRWPGWSMTRRTATSLRSRGSASFCSRGHSWQEEGRPLGRPSQLLPVL